MVPHSHPPRHDDGPEPSSDDLFLSILSAPDRDRCPLARPVISVAEDDEAAYLNAVEDAATDAVTLERRGAFHGEWAVLDPARLPAELGHGDDPEDAVYEAELGHRWRSSRPVVLHGVLRPLMEPFLDALIDSEELRDSLAEEGGLRRFLEARRADLEPDFRLIGRRASLVDRERDVERVLLESFAPGGGGRDVSDLWLKSSWLSTHEDDASLRMRFSFGSERDDDASRDVLRHRLVAELMRRLLPESTLVTQHPALVPFVERLCGEPVLFTQGIAYWNAPNGGALFHHDAFAEDALDGGSWRQFGVCYAQLTGATAWLALSTDDLVARVREFAESLDEGAMPWVRAQLFESPRAPVPGGFRGFRELAENPDRLRAELALPGQGRLAPLVNRGPEFTSFLADAGHAYVIEAGDVILLPNHGLTDTCLHSVFCASDETGYSLSLALRPDREAPEEVEARAGGARAARIRELGRGEEPRAHGDRE